MTKSVLKIGLLSLVLVGTFSCKKNDSELADQRISELEKYVDSVKAVSAEDREKNWDKIAEDFDKKTANANEATEKLDAEAKASSQERITTTTVKYAEIKASMMPEKEAVAPASPSQLLRDRLFGAGKVGTDMNFDWVNKDNILQTYQNFLDAYEKNKSDFSREDFDEVKLMYEALDSRKNTVEKEGLSSEDNNKIASIKFRFAPMFKVNRMGAKSRENSEAKE